MFKVGLAVSRGNQRERFAKGFIKLLFFRAAFFFRTCFSLEQAYSIGLSSG